jgi:hypothetical protein
MGSRFALLWIGLRDAVVGAGKECTELAVLGRVIAGDRGGAPRNAVQQLKRHACMPAIPWGSRQGARNRVTTQVPQSEPRNARNTRTARTRRPVHSGHFSRLSYVSRLSPPEQLRNRDGAACRRSRERAPKLGVGKGASGGEWWERVLVRRKRRRCGDRRREQGGREGRISPR